MTKDEALKLALDALETSMYPQQKQLQAITAIKEALAQPDFEKIADDLQNICDKQALKLGHLEALLAQPEQEPVAWLITDEKINSLQVDSIQRLIDRARHAHMTDIKLRINGQDEWFQADWLKHLTRTTPPQRKPLTDKEIGAILEDINAFGTRLYTFARAIEAAHGIKENT